MSFRDLRAFVMLTMGVVGKYAPSPRISHLVMYAYIRFNCIFVFPPLPMVKNCAIYLPNELSRLASYLSHTCNYESRFPLSRPPKSKPEIRNSKRYISLMILHSYSFDLTFLFFSLGPSLFKLLTIFPHHLPFIC